MRQTAEIHVQPPRENRLSSPAPFRQMEAQGPAGGLGKSRSLLRVEPSLCLGHGGVLGAGGAGPDAPHHQHCQMTAGEAAGGPFSAPLQPPFLTSVVSPAAPESTREAWEDRAHPLGWPGPLFWVSPPAPGLLGLSGGAGARPPRVPTSWAVC